MNKEKKVAEYCKKLGEHGWALELDDEFRKLNEVFALIWDRSTISDSKLLEIRRDYCFYSESDKGIADSARNPEKIFHETVYTVTNPDIIQDLVKQVEEAEIFMLETFCNVNAPRERNTARSNLEIYPLGKYRVHVDLYCYENEILMEFLHKLQNAILEKADKKEEKVIEPET